MGEKNGFILKTTVLHYLEKVYSIFFLLLCHRFTQLGHNNTLAIFDLHIILFLHSQSSVRHYTICSASIARGCSKIIVLKFQARTLSPHLNSEVFMAMSCKTPTQQHKVKKKISLFPLPLWSREKNRLVLCIQASRCWIRAVGAGASVKCSSSLSSKMRK